MLKTSQVATAETAAKLLQRRWSALDPAAVLCKRNLLAVRECTTGGRHIGADGVAEDAAGDLHLKSSISPKHHAT